MVWFKNQKKKFIVHVKYRIVKNKAFNWVIYMLWILIYIWMLQMICANFLSWIYYDTIYKSSDNNIYSYVIIANFLQSDFWLIEETVVIVIRMFLVWTTEKRIPRELGNCRATSELLKRFHRQFQGEEEGEISYIFQMEEIATDIRRLKSVSATDSNWK